MRTTFSTSWWLLSKSIYTWTAVLFPWDISHDWIGPSSSRVKLKAKVCSFFGVQYDLMSLPWWHSSRWIAQVRDLWIEKIVHGFKKSSFRLRDDPSIISSSGLKLKKNRKVTERINARVHRQFVAQNHLSRFSQRVRRRQRGGGGYSCLPRGKKKLQVDNAQATIHGRRKAVLEKRIV